MTTAEPLWTVREVAAFLSMSGSWVYKEAEAGRLPTLRLGAALRFRPEDIRRWVDQRGKIATVSNLRDLRGV